MFLDFVEGVIMGAMRHILSSFTRIITFFSLLNNQRDHTLSTIINNGVIG
jgi:hypothetical protein